MSDVVVDRDPFAHAAASGMVVVLPAPHELFVDIDHPPASETATLAAHLARDRIDRFCTEFEWTAAYSYTTSPGGNVHLYAALQAADGATIELDVATRIALQAAAGSDGMREVLALCRVHHDYEALEKPIVCFFEKPDTTRRDTLCEL